MKRVFILLSSVFIFTGCIKNDPVLFTNPVVEFDAATWNANAVGVTYPILTRVPVESVATPTSSPSLTRTTGNVQLRVNLIGAQKGTATDFTYSVVMAESSAIAGTHFTALSGTGSIAANTSFGYITVPILNPGATTTGPKVLVLQLLDNTGTKANVNYAKVGLSIAQN